MFRSTWLLAAAIIAVLVLAAPTIASASGEYEPNDTFSTATGPVADGTYSAVFETANDEDWYRIDTEDQDVQVMINMTNWASWMPICSPKLPLPMP